MDCALFKGTAAKIAIMLKNTGIVVSGLIQI